MRKLYLAYGSNLNKRQMQLRCPQAKPVGTATLHNYELLFKGSKTGAYLTVESHRGMCVPVAVWEVNKADEATLDRYEGFPNFYYKKEVKLDIHFFDGHNERLSAFVYIMHEDRKIGIPSPIYVNTCLEGYQDFDFDRKNIDKAIERSMQHEEK